MMCEISISVFNRVEKLPPPPFISTIVESKEERSLIFKTWSDLRKRKSTLEELRGTLEAEGDLLSGFIVRKGTQLRLEKALMLSIRIDKLGKRWVGNRWLAEYTNFDEGLQLSLVHKKKKKAMEKVEEEGVRLPSRQWANWIIYVTLRDCLILAKIKVECERTVKYWLGLISSSHHATDSLVAVGILSRMWYVSSCMAETLINVMYPTVCKLSIHLEPTKAENWLTDLEIPSPENLNSWIEFVLGSPFVPAQLNKTMTTISQGVVVKGKMESVLEKASSPYEPITSGSNEPSTSSKSKGNSSTGNSQASPVASTSAIDPSKVSEEEEDFGVPVDVELSEEGISSQQKRKGKQGKKKKIPSAAAKEMDERWTRFFSGHKSKLKTDKGKKQFLVRIRKYLQDESNEKITLRLKKLRKCIKTGPYDEMITMINQFQNFLLKESK